MLPVTNVAKDNNGILKSTFPTYIPLQSTIALLFYNCWACRGCDWKLALFSSPGLAMPVIEPDPIVVSGGI